MRRATISAAGARRGRPRLCGLVLEALAAAGVEPQVPRFAMRGHEPGAVVAFLVDVGLQRAAPDDAREGDILLSFPAPRQAHLAVRTDSGFVEANAGLRRVTERLWDGTGRWHSAWRLAGETD